MLAQNVPARIAKENPDYREGMDCLYVGQTGKSPEERFKEHLSSGDFTAIRTVTRFGKCLRPNLYEGWNPLADYFGHSSRQAAASCSARALSRPVLSPLSLRSTTPID